MSRGKRNKPIEKCCESCGETFFVNGTGKNKIWCSDCKIGYNNYPVKLRRLVQMAKNRATDKNVPFDIDAEYIINLWEENDGCCALTGRKFDLSRPAFKTTNPNTPSIDRIKPSLGYTKGNVRLIVYHLNMALADYGTDAFEQLCKDFLSA